jgi:hypothetical protein
MMIRLPNLVLSALLTALLLAPIPNGSAFFTSVLLRSSHHESLSMISDPTLRLKRPYRVGEDSSSRLHVSNGDIRSKPRQVVAFDASTGNIIQEKQKQSIWGSFKLSVYGSVDAAGSFLSKIRTKDSTRVPPVDGYTDIIERRILRDDGVATPGERLMKQYRQKQELKAPMQVAQPKDSLFDSLKESLYAVADMKSKPPQETLTPQPRIQTFKPSVQPNIALVPEIREALPKLQSQNPLERWRAQRKIRKWEEQYRRRQMALEREARIQAFREGVYTVVDTFQAGAELVTKTPGNIVTAAGETQRAAESLVNWASTVPGAIESTAYKVAAIPGQIKQTADGAQQFVKDVASIPSKVKGTVDDAQRTVQQTVDSVNSAITEAKYLTGLEKRPPPPPKEYTVSDIAWDVAGGLAKGTAKAAFWLGKGVLQLGWKGAKAAFVSATSQNATPLQTKATDVLRTQAEFPPVPPKQPPPMELLEVTASAPPTATSTSDKVDREVSEALKLANAALRNARTASATSVDKDLEDAVRRAKEAAIAATQDAVEIEGRLALNQSDPRRQ